MATAPPAALPKDVQRFSKKIVIDRAVEVAEAGFRVTLHEPTGRQRGAAGDGLPRQQVRAAAASSTRGQRTWRSRRRTSAAFDALRRQSVRGDRFADAVAALLAPDLLAKGPQTFHNDLESRWSYRPGHVSALIASPGGNAPPYRLSLIDADGRRVGGTAENSKVVKQIPFSDLFTFAQTGGAIGGEMAVIASPLPGQFTVRLDRVDSVSDGTPYVLSLAVPDATGSLRQLVFQGTAGQTIPIVAPSADPYQLRVEVFNGDTAANGSPLAPQTIPVLNPPPTILGVVQQNDADMFRCDPDALGGPARPRRRRAVQRGSDRRERAGQAEAGRHHQLCGRPQRRRRRRAAAGPPHRVPRASRSIRPVRSRAVDRFERHGRRDQAMPPVTLPIESTIGDEGGVVSGKVIRADGTPVPFASVRLFYLLGCENPAWVGISSKTADAEGRYQWDFVSKLAANRIVAVDAETEESRDVRFNVRATDSG